MCTKLHIIAGDETQASHPRRPPRPPPPGYATGYAPVEELYRCGLCSFGGLTERWQKKTANQLLTGEFVDRLQQLTEFECVVKAFIYMATHFSRGEIIEPAMDEVAEQIACDMKKMLMIASSGNAAPFFGGDLDMNGLTATITQSLSKAAGALEAPLCKTEPDIFPCMVVICGSAFAFLKVSSLPYCSVAVCVNVQMYPMLD